jgi:glycosyltransferase involved in cell wall biosynthesis
MGNPDICSDTAGDRMVPIKVNWEGSLFVHHSLGMVNREILRALASDPRFSVRHVPYEPDSFSMGSSPEFEALRGMIGAPYAAAAMHVRHRWPPDFTPPSSGRYVLFQPWEYGSLPVEWVEKIPKVVHEVWVYTDYLRECYIASGLDPALVRVIPLGIGPDEFKPDVAPAAWLRERTGERFCFLFNGGITLRKGVDILVNAYLNEFRADEQVCLVIKGSNAYKKELALQVETLSRRPGIAGILYLTDDILPRELPSLYAACDCYVHPYRAEGYGLPIAEAMACGKPVIVTGAGACRDFADEQTAYCIRCSMEKLAAREVGGIPLVGNAFWLLPDVNDLRRLMRHVFENRDEALRKGMMASKKIREHHTWKHAAEAVAERIIKIAN